MATVKRTKARLASKKKTGSHKACPTCSKDMVVVKIVRHSGPSGMFWRCESGHELPTR